VILVIASPLPLPFDIAFALQAIEVSCHEVRGARV
jgi:hypothetical protein